MAARILDDLNEVQRRANNGDRYIFKKVLGKGAFGCVFLAEDTERERAKVAVKICCLGKMVSKATLDSQLKEVRTLSRLKSDLVIAMKEAYLFDCGPHEYGLGIVTEYCSNGNLNDFLVENSTTLSGPQKKTFMLQFAFGLQAIHDIGFAHRDLKPENLLLDKGLNLKIADFGLAKATWDIGLNFMSHGPISLEGYMTTEAGTPVFMAPEVFEGHYQQSADVFSAGLVLVCIAFPERFVTQYGSSMKIMPVINARSVSLGKQMADETAQVATARLEIQSLLPRTFLDLIDSMLLRDPKKRPTTKTVMEKLIPIDLSSPRIAQASSSSGATRGRAARSTPSTRPPALWSSKARPLSRAAADTLRTMAPSASGMLVPKLGLLDPED